MTNHPDGDRLRQLEDRLSALRKSQEPDRKPGKGGEKYDQANMAWTMVIELVAGLGIGFGIGIGLDALFGTRPWLLVLFTLLGFAAGVQTMMRTAHDYQRRRKAGAGVPPGAKATEVADETPAALAAEKTPGADAPKD